MTSEEAKQKWCPFIRCDGQLEGQAVSGNCTEETRHPLYACCIGSDCAVWAENRCGLAYPKKFRTHLG